jgi:hypothetical protein
MGNMAKSNENLCLVTLRKIKKPKKATECRQSSDEARKSTDLTKGNMYIANNALIWQTP